MTPAYYLILAAILFTIGDRLRSAPLPSGSRAGAATDMVFA